MSLLLEYWFWLVIVGLFCTLLERLWTWRRRQRVLRRGLAQDLFWLVFNGHFLGLSLASLTEPAATLFGRLMVDAGLPAPESIRLLEGTALWLQFLIVVLVKDLVEYLIHRLMHGVSFLWHFHKLHHSIEQLDWIGNFRFHWGEVLVYKTLSYVPLVLLGTDPLVLLAIAVLWTLMLSLNHANVPLSWGPLRYVLNSPRMHVWHHDYENHRPNGQNFGQVLSLWDWLLGTAWWPADRDQPPRLGFEGIARFPRNLVERFVGFRLRSRR